MAPRGGATSAECIGLLDIGSSKVVCAIANVARGSAGDRRVTEVIGIGYQKSRGMRGGFVGNLDDAESAVRSAVSQAEQSAGVTIESAVSTVSCGRIQSQRFHAHVPLAREPVSQTHVDRLQDAAEGYARRGGRMLMHCNRIDFGLDGHFGIWEPHGLRGERLTGSYHAIGGDEGPIRNLGAVISRCLLGCDALVPAPIASALAVTSPDERELGVLVIDFGGGTTSYAEYFAGRLVDCGVLPYGGELVTYDLARRLGASISEAERIKTLYGSMVGAQSDADAQISYMTGLGGQTRERGGPDGRTSGGGVAYTNRALVHDVVRGRVLRQIDSFWSRQLEMAAADGGDWDAPNLVLTGGGSQVAALATVVQQRFGVPVRLGSPAPFAVGAENLSAPQFAAVAGLARCLPQAQTSRVGKRRAPSDGKPFRPMPPSARPEYRSTAPSGGRPGVNSGPGLPMGAQGAGRPLAGRAASPTGYLSRVARWVRDAF